MIGEREYVFKEYGCKGNYDIVNDILFDYGIDDSVLRARFCYGGYSAVTYDWCNWYLNLFLCLDLYVTMEVSGK